MSHAFRPGCGAELRAARERRKLTTADVAAKLKFAVRQVEALEAEDFSHLPDDVFTRGFVRNYARLVGLDPDTLITPVNLEQTATEAITAPSAGVSLSTRGLRRWLLTPLLLLTAFLMLVALLYYWLRQGEDALLPAPVPSQSEEAVVPPPARELPAPSVMQAPGPTPGARAAVPMAEGADVAVPTAVTPPPPAGLVVSPSPPPRDIAPERSGGPAPVTTGRHTLRFEPELDAWVQVVDNRGNSFSKLIRAGTSETFSGEPPFRLVVGEAARVKLTYNGHSIDLRPFIGQKVARLTLE